MTARRTAIQALILGLCLLCASCRSDARPHITVPDRGHMIEAMGAEFDPHLWSQNIVMRGIDSTAWDTARRRVKQMGLKRMRVMVLPAWYEPANDNGDPHAADMERFTMNSAEMESLYRVLDLAEECGATVTLVMWGLQPHVRLGHRHRLPLGRQILARRREHDAGLVHTLNRRRGVEREHRRPATVAHRDEGIRLHRRVHADERTQLVVCRRRCARARSLQPHVRGRRCPPATGGAARQGAVQPLGRRTERRFPSPCRRDGGRCGRLLQLAHLSVRIRDSRLDNCRMGTPQLRHSSPDGQAALHRRVRVEPYDGSVAADRHRPLRTRRAHDTHSTLAAQRRCGGRELLVAAGPVLRLHRPLRLDAAAGAVALGPRGVPRAMQSTTR